MTLRKQIPNKKYQNQINNTRINHIIKINWGTRIIKALYNHEKSIKLNFWVFEKKNRNQTWPVEMITGSRMSCLERGQQK